MKLFQIIISAFRIIIFFEAYANTRTLIYKNKQNTNYLYE